MASPFPPGADLSRIPSGEPPPGVHPNFINPPTNTVAIVVTGVVGAVLVLFFVLIRLFANFHIARKHGWDDYACIAATVLVFAYTGLVVSMAQHSRHMWDIPVSSFSPGYFMRIYASNMLTPFMSFFAKLSVFLLYLRFFSVKQRFRYAVYFGIGFAFCFYVVGIPLFTIYCTPRAGEAWDLALGRKCDKLVIVAIATGPINVLLDIYMLLLPLPVVAQLHLPLKKKLGLMVIFMTGIFAIAGSVTSLYFRVKLGQNTDRIWNEAYVYIAATVENDISIICGSMPACAAFSKTYFTSFTYLTSLRSRLVSRMRSSYGTKDETLVASKSLSAPKPCRNSLPRSYSVSNPRKDRYIELDEDLGLNESGKYNSSGVNGISNGSKTDLERGVTNKYVGVQQKSHQASFS